MITHLWHCSFGSLSIYLKPTAVKGLLRGISITNFDIINLEELLSVVVSEATQLANWAWLVTQDRLMPFFMKISIL